MYKKFLPLAICTAVAGSAIAAGPETPQEWFDAGKATVAKSVKTKANEKRAKNVILFIGDGMGISTVTAARIFEGQIHGESGEENLLSFEEFPYVALSKTYNTNQQTPDSAGTMTAMMTGVKTKAGVIGVNQNAIRSNCASSYGTELTSFLEEAEDAGWSTGIVSTARITHATPAATYAKSAERDWEDWSDMTQEARDNGCRDIADQLVNFDHGDGIDVILGGGRRHFLRKVAEDNSPDAISAIEGDRTDGRNLVDEWQALHPDGQYVIGQDDFDAVNPESTSKLLGLFNESHMQYEADRANDILGEPSLTEMTEKAISILDNNKEGFFLMVESGRIDHAHHAGNAYNALSDTVELARAVKRAKELAGDDTLILVTADHSHVFTIAGYPTRGNPILGKVVGNDGSGEPNGIANAADGKPYTTVGYTNGLGFMDLGEETDADESYNHGINTGRFDLTGVDTEAPGFHQEALIPLESETHSGEDVAIYATGPGAYAVKGVVEQNVIYHVMENAVKGFKD